MLKIRVEMKRTIDGIYSRMIISKNKVVSWKIKLGTHPGTAEIKEIENIREGLKYLENRIINPYDTNPKRKLKDPQSTNIYKEIPIL